MARRALTACSRCGAEHSARRGAPQNRLGLARLAIDVGAGLDLRQCGCGNGVGFEIRSLILTPELYAKAERDEKTQTRRLIREDWWRCLDPEDEADRDQALRQCPYGEVGTVLYVRTRWAEADSGPIYLAADYPDGGNPTGESAWRWRPSIHMRREDARLFLEVTKIRCERLQKISEYDVVREGIALPRCGCDVCRHSAQMCPADASAHIEEFRALWDAINGKREGGVWARNPWVWVIGFKRVREPRIVGAGS